MASYSLTNTTSDGTGAWTVTAGAGVVSLQIPSTAVLTANSPGDLVSITVPSQVARYVVHSVYIETISATGTLALCTIDLRTATGGGGASLLNAATALTSLTSANLAQSLTVAALGSVLTAGTLTVRQTVNSANAGNIAGVINLIPVP